MPIHKINGKKQDGLQKYRVRINYLSNDGKKRQLTRIVYGKEAAYELERKLSSEIKDDNKKPVKNMTIDQLYQEYMSVQKFEVREVTIYKTQQTYNLYIKPIVAGVRLDKITMQKLQD